MGRPGCQPQFCLPLATCQSTQHLAFLIYQIAMNLSLSLCHNCFLRAQYVPARKTCLLPENARHQKPRRGLLNYLWLHFPLPSYPPEQRKSKLVAHDQSNSPSRSVQAIQGTCPGVFLIGKYFSILLSLSKLGKSGRGQIKSKRCFQGNGTEHTLGPVFCFFF